MYIHIHLGLVMRKPVFGIFDQVRLKPACSATENSYCLDLALESIGIILSKKRTTKALIRLRIVLIRLRIALSDCADAQADLYLYCSHMAQAGFLMTWLTCGLLQKT